MRLILKIEVLILVRLQIEKEKLFVDIYQRHAGAMCWEEKARHLLATRAPMSDFEDVLRWFYFKIFPHS